MNMKNTITLLTAATLSLIGFAKEHIPGTANSIKDIRAGVPIVTNAMMAINAFMKPVESSVEIIETTDELKGVMVCYPNRVNVITNTPGDLMDLDSGLQCFSVGDFRTWDLYFGPEYRELIITPKEHAITIRPADGVTINNSTNDFLITKVPAMIHSKQLLDKKIWMTVEYPVFTYLPVELNKIEFDAAENKIVLIGTNLNYITSNNTYRTVKYFLDTDTSKTNDVQFSIVETSHFTEWSYSTNTFKSLVWAKLTEDSDYSWLYKKEGDETLYDTGVKNEKVNEITVTNEEGLLFKATRDWVESEPVLVNTSIYSTLPTDVQVTFIVTTAIKAFEYEYVTRTLNFSKPTPMSVSTPVKNEKMETEDVKEIEEENGFFSSIVEFFTDLF